MAKANKRSASELSKRDMQTLWGYCDSWQGKYRDMSYAALKNETLDAKRRRVLASDYLTRMAEMDELKKALTVAIDGCGDDDDDE